MLRPISNPPNPWISSQIEYLDEVPEARLEVYEDHTKNILAENDSPDVGFGYSVNPYRGCYHACAYCMAGDTLVSMGDGSTRALRDLRAGDVVVGTKVDGRYRRYMRSRVVAHWETSKIAWRIRLEDGTELVASGDHRFLTWRGWKYVTGTENGRERRPHLTTNDKLLGFGAVRESPKETVDYRQGYLCGMIRGDGLLKVFRYQRAGRSQGDQYQFRLAMADPEALQRTRHYLLDYGVLTHRVLFQAASARRRAMTAIRSYARKKLVEPAISRKREFVGTAIKSNAPLRVVSVENTGIEMPMFDITTETADFIANGVVSHNCYARPGHEYLSFGAGTDFERKIVVKPRAAELLREAFDKKSWQGDLVVFSGVTDCYQPLEASLELTRGCLKVCAEYRNPVGIITKAPLIERDLDVLGRLHEVASVHVMMSIPFWNPDNARAIEPYVATPQRRLKTLGRLAAAGLPVGVMVAPMIPGLNDEDMVRVLEAAAEAGARSAGTVFLRLPGPVKQVFEERVREALPLRADKILRKIREARGGKLNDARPFVRQRGEGAYAESARALFETTCRRLGLNAEDRYAERPKTFARPAKAGDQLRLL